MRQGDRLRALEKALVRRVPTASEWVRGPQSIESGSALGDEHWIQVISPDRPDTQRLTILLRHDGDIQVEYHVAGKKGSPFEALFVLEEGAEREAIDEVARFVGELIDE